MRALELLTDQLATTVAEHCQRVSVLTSELALALGWTKGDAERLVQAARIHDVGKLSIPESALYRPGPLRPQDVGLVRGHVATGARIASEILDEDQVAWIRSHHERWDGRGYPDRLSGSQIPEGALVLGIADAWDAMTHACAYRAPLTELQARDELARCSGAQFAPHVVAAALWRTAPPSQA